jgi:hypothetical protein
MNLQESIRRILKEEMEPGIFIEVIERMLEHFKKKDCICDIRVSFDVEDPDYNIYLVFSQEELHDKFLNLYRIRSYIQEMRDEVKMQLEVFLPIRNIFVGYYTKPNCEWSPLNESKGKKEDYFLKLINNLIQRIKSTNNEICDMWVEYNSEDGDYEIRTSTTITTAEYFDSNLRDVLELIDNTISSWGLNVYVFAPYYVKKCGEEIKYINESKLSGNTNLQKNLIKGIINSYDVSDCKHFCGVDIITPEERDDQYYYSNKDKIPYLVKVYFVGGPNSEVWPRTQRILYKELDLMNNLLKTIKLFVPFNTEIVRSYVNSCGGYDKLMNRKYTTDDLQESIKRVLREETEDTSLRDTILRSIKSIGVELTTKAVGGFKNLCKILNINSPMDYLHLFDDLKIIPLSETELSWEFDDDPDVICYGYNPDNIIFIHFTINYNYLIDIKSECRISYEEIWKILAQEFELTLKEIKELTKEWLNSVYDLQVTNTDNDSDL